MAASQDIMQLKVRLFGISPMICPLGWLHINLTGDYSWDADDDSMRTEFRPLNLASMRMPA